MRSRFITSCFLPGLIALGLLLSGFSRESGTPTLPGWLTAAICHAPDDPAAPALPAHDHTHCDSCLPGHPMGPLAMAPALPGRGVGAIVVADPVWTEGPARVLVLAYASRAPPRTS
jgi:hypothetical protein